MSAPVMLQLSLIDAHILELNASVAAITAIKTDVTSTMVEAAVKYAALTPVPVDYASALASQVTVNTIFTTITGYKSAAVSARASFNKNTSESDAISRQNVILRNVKLAKAQVAQAEELKKLVAANLAALAADTAYNAAAAEANTKDAEVVTAVGVTAAAAQAVIAADAAAKSARESTRSAASQAYVNQLETERAAAAADAAALKLSVEAAATAAAEAAAEEARLLANAELASETADANTEVPNGLVVESVVSGAVTIKYTIPNGVSEVLLEYFSLDGSVFESKRLSSIPDFNSGSLIEKLSNAVPGRFTLTDLPLGMPINVEFMALDSFGVVLKESKITVVAAIKPAVPRIASINSEDGFIAVTLDRNGPFSGANINRATLSLYRIGSKSVETLNLDMNSDFGPDGTMRFNITSSQLPLIKGKMYKARISLTNIAGRSEMSDAYTFAYAVVPDEPTNVSLARDPFENVSYVTVDRTTNLDTFNDVFINVNTYITVASVSQPILYRTFKIPAPVYVAPPVVVAEHMSPAVRPLLSLQSPAPAPAPAKKWAEQFVLNFPTTTRGIIKKFLSEKGINDSRADILCGVTFSSGLLVSSETMSSAGSPLKWLASDYTQIDVFKRFLKLKSSVTRSAVNGAVNLKLVGSLSRPDDVSLSDFNTALNNLKNGSTPLVMNIVAQYIAVVEDVRTPKYLKIQLSQSQQSVTGTGFNADNSQDVEELDVASLKSLKVKFFLTAGPNVTGYEELDDLPVNIPSFVTDVFARFYDGKVRYTMNYLQGNCGPSTALMVYGRKGLALVKTSKSLAVAFEKAEEKHCCDFAIVDSEFAGEEISCRMEVFDNFPTTGLVRSFDQSQLAPPNDISSVLVVVDKYDALLDTPIVAVNSNFSPDLEPDNRCFIGIGKLALRKLLLLADVDELDEPVDEDSDGKVTFAARSDSKSKEEQVLRQIDIEPMVMSCRLLNSKDKEVKLSIPTTSDASSKALSACLSYANATTPIAEPVFWLEVALYEKRDLNTRVSFDLGEHKFTLSAGRTVNTLDTTDAASYAFTESDLKVINFKAAANMQGEHPIYATENTIAVSIDMRDNAFVTMTVIPLPNAGQSDYNIAKQTKTFTIRSADLVKDSKGPNAKTYFACEFDGKSPGYVLLLSSPVVNGVDTLLVDVVDNSLPPFTAGGNQLVLPEFISKNLASKRIAANSSN
jgi:hypothetical protein